MTENKFTPEQLVRILQEAEVWAVESIGKSTPPRVFFHASGRKVVTMGISAGAA